MSYRVQDLNSIVKASDRNYPVVNTQGDLLFTSFNNIFNGAIFNSPRIYSFNGRDVSTDPTWPHKFVWHGSTIRGIRAEEANCNTWQTAGTPSIGLASKLSSGSLVDNYQQSCDKPLIVLCIEVLAKSTRTKRHLDEINDELEYQRFIEAQESS